jgi:hypothetical protein
VQWWVGVIIPITAVLGGLIGAWWQKQATKGSNTAAILAVQFEALWSPHPQRRKAALETIDQLMEEGRLDRDQLMAASIQLKCWAAVNWDLDERQRQSMESRMDKTRGVV